MSKPLGLLAAGLLLAASASSQELTTVRVATGLDQPVYLTHAPGDANHLFVVEQPGLIRIIEDGALLPTPFLDLQSLVRSGGERGLLGLAFHPDYAANDAFYVNYTNQSGDTVVARYLVSADPLQADPQSAAILLTIDQPFSNHNGGMLEFSPNDGHLYIGMGDGGSAGDPGNRSQNDNQPLGKMLRIAVDGGTSYTIPPDNPFVGEVPLDEIWAKGLRNPWRFSFDRDTGDLWIADVGQNLWEEIDFQPASSSGGENYGWRLMEGDHCYNPPVDCNPLGDLVLPLYEFSHGGNPFRCSITGGYVYRGAAAPTAVGAYFFADFCSQQIWSLRQTVDGVEVVDHTDELAPGPGLSINDIASFGEDAAGELYVVELSGEIYKMIPRLRLDVDPLEAGAMATARVQGATPGQQVWFAISLRGAGQTDVPQLEVSLEVDQAKQIGHATADAMGNASISALVPGGAAGRQIHLQALELRNKSDVEVRTVQ